MARSTSQLVAKRAGDGQRLVKSAERVRDLGEVFTPRHVVNDMLDLLPSEVWNPCPPATFLEPACGDGNFIVAILDRKLEHVSRHTDDPELRQLLSLVALSSIYGVDISPDNILGGHPEHPIGARQRVIDHLTDWCAMSLGAAPDADDWFLRAAEWIATQNLQVGDMLHNGGLDIPIVGYDWQVDQRRVSVTWLTIGLIQIHANAGGDPDVLFDDAQTTPLPDPAHRAEWDEMHLLPFHPGKQIDLRGEVPS